MLLLAVDSSMEITDQFYSILNDNEIKERMTKLGHETGTKITDEEIVELFRQFIR